MKLIEDIGKVRFSDKMENLQLNQWKNSTDVIRWFENIQQKKNYTFTVFDIQEFYPSINEKLLKDSIALAQIVINLTLKRYRSYIPFTKVNTLP